MKNILKAFVLTLSIILLTGIKGEAVEVLPPNVKLVGDANGIVFVNGDEPFLCKYNMLPGDSVKRTMTLKNVHKDSYDIYIRAERVTKSKQYDLLKKINLVVKYDGNIIYNGPIASKNGLSNEIFLGKVKPGEEKKLEAEAVFDGKTIGNEYKNKYAEVEWIFTGIKIPEQMINKENNYNLNNKKMNGILPKTGYENFYFIGILIASIGIISILKKDKKFSK